MTTTTTTKFARIITEDEFLTIDGEFDGIVGWAKITDMLEGEEIVMDMWDMLDVINAIARLSQVEGEVEVKVEPENPTGMNIKVAGTPYGEGIIVSLEQGLNYIDLTDEVAMRVNEVLLRFFQA